MRRATVGRRLATADPEGDGPCEKVVSGCVQVHIENKGSVDTALTIPDEDGCDMYLYSAPVLVPRIHGKIRS